MKNLTHLLTAIILLFISVSVKAQNKPLVYSGAPVEVVHGQNANLYNQITDIFQAAIHDGLLKSGNNEFQLVSSWYGLQQLFKPAKKTFTDNEYIDSKNARNLNISIITGFDNINSRITSFSPSVKYALVNNRDVNNLGTAAVGFWNNLNDSLRNIVTQSDRFVKKLTDRQNKEKDPIKLKKIQYAITHMTTLAADTTVAQLGAFFTDIGVVLDKADSLQLGQYVSAYKKIKKPYDALVASVAGGKLLTLQGGSLFKNNGLYGMNAKLEFLVGTGWKADKDKPWDFDAYLSANLNKDSTEVNPTSLNRQVYSGYVGLNKVLLYTEQQPNSTAASQSLLEIKGSAGADYIPNVRYLKENEWNLNLDFTLSLRLAGNLYLPVEIKYAPAKSAFLGLFKLQYTIPTVSSTK